MNKERLEPLGLVGDFVHEMDDMSPGYLCNKSLHYFAVPKKTSKEA